MCINVFDQYLYSVILYFYYFNNKNMISQSGDIKYTWHYLLMPLANESFRNSICLRRYINSLLAKFP